MDIEGVEYGGKEMMFGIKSKKDKRIEELEKLLLSPAYNQPKIIESKGDIITYRARYTLREGGNPSTDVVKRILSRELADKIMNDMELDFQTEGDMWVITADIKIIK